MTFNGKTVLVTGGTGSFGSKLIEVLLERARPEARSGCSAATS